MNEPDEPEERKRKPVVYHEGKQAAVRFESAIRHILSVPKAQVVKAAIRSTMPARARNFWRAHQTSLA